MALTTCRECKKEVSTDAKTCPHCGTSSPAAKSKPISAGTGCAFVVVAILVLGVVSIAIDGISGKRNSESRPQPAQPSAPPAATPQGTSGVDSRLPIGANRGGIAATYPEVTFTGNTLTSGEHSGEETFTGPSSDKGIIVEILGPARAPISATVVAGLANDNPDWTSKNISRTIDLLKLTTGDSKTCSDWFLAAVKRLPKASTQKTVCGGRAIKVEAIKGAGMLVTTISAR